MLEIKIIFITILSLATLITGLLAYFLIKNNKLKPRKFFQYKLTISISLLAIFLTAIFVILAMEI